MGDFPCVGHSIMITVGIGSGRARGRSRGHPIDRIVAVSRIVHSLKRGSGAVRADWPRGGIGVMHPFHEDERNIPRIGVGWSLWGIGLVQLDLVGTVVELAG